MLKTVCKKIGTSTLSLKFLSSEIVLSLYKCDALPNLVPFAQFKKHEKHSSMGVFTFFKLYKWYKIAQNINIPSVLGRNTVVGASASNFYFDMFKKLKKRVMYRVVGPAMDMSL